MIIRCWGARGAIPVSGREYLRYGGDTTCIEIRTNDDNIIIIDAGSGIRRLGNRVTKEDREKFTIIFTHAHWDHLLGFPFFEPIYNRGTYIDIFGCPFAQQSVKNMVLQTMLPPNFPISFEDIKANISYHGICEDSFSIGSMVVTPILLNHPNQGIGYKFVEDDRCFVFLTDNELRFKHIGGLDYQDYLNFSSNADFLIHDAEFTEEEYKRTKRWGHSVYKDALRLALEARVKMFGLFHHNQERTDAELEVIVKDCRGIIKSNKGNLECFALCQETEIKL
jgi:phosphoribosyl 1,2-cyclic phosphodiesterase